jgi:hypothetical protein
MKITEEFFQVEIFWVLRNEIESSYFLNKLNEIVKTTCKVHENSLKILKSYPKISAVMCLAH